MKTIAIIGNSGTNARPWTDAFLAAGWNVRKLVREPRQVGPQPRLSAAAFDFDTTGSYTPALAGTDLLALVTPARPQQVAWETALIEAARREGVAILKLSVIGADMPTPISAFARWAAGSEAALRASGVPHIVLRANGFMQNLLRQRASIAAGTYVEPFGAVAASHVDVHDIADVAAAVAEGPFDGRVLTLTGPAALRGEEIAGVLASALSRPVRYVSPPLPAFRGALVERGMPPWQIEIFMELYEAVQAGRAPHLATVTGDIEAATRSKPRTLEAFARREFGSPTLS